MQIDPIFLEKLIIKAIRADQHFLILVTSAFINDFFTIEIAGKVFDVCKRHFEEYKSIPNDQIIVNSLPEGERRDAANFLTDIDSIDFNVAQNYDFLFSQTNNFLKQQAIKTAILQSIKVIDDGNEVDTIRKLVEDALTLDLKVDIGLKYFEMLGERLRRIFTAPQNKVPTFFPVFDDFIVGGFPPLTFSVIVAKIHGFKSTTMANFIARQVLAGYNAVLVTLEMSEDMFAQRFDSIYSLLDINRIYIIEEYKQRLVERLREVKDIENRGEIYIKQFPTGAASIKDIRIYLRELLIRGINLDILYVDYINLMRSSYYSGIDMYTKVKSIAEELRSLSFEFELPVVSVSQLNRSGGFQGFEELDFNYIAESMGLPATCDFMAIYGTDEDKMVYESQLFYKIVKNRLGGRVGAVDHFYYDTRNLRMYDSSELDQWMEDANVSLDSRNLFEREEDNG